ncbi:NUMOD4 domain-containing protein [Staphylococcus arlettae]|uniref:NUMOD4 domain-containing protein n=1 Tax=Staphylococcus arlettae TaxID=29378 RepID=UPI002DBD7772|nr:NUMOD4 domain-containing protein [Staphylococcus arlettae]MEB5899833.1 NUMOD4 motif-containing HNH endonuclease [Staphylococcus arlettae]
MTEQWKQIDGFPDYMVSDEGRIWSKTRIIKRPSGNYLRRGCFMKGIDDTHGYLILGIKNKNHITKKVKIHRLVAKTFLKNPHNKREVNHINGIKTDNRKSNLEWMTSKENKIHAWNIGLYKKQDRSKLSGENNPTSKFTENQVREIRRIYGQGGISQKSLGKLYNTSQAQIYYIVNRITWKNIEEDENVRLQRKV